MSKKKPDAQPKAETSGATAPKRPRYYKSRPPAHFAALLAAGDSYTAIGAAIGVDRDAVAKWAARPEIVAQVTRIQERAADLAVRRLAGLQDRAVDALSQVLDDTRVAASSARVRAVAEVLDRTGVPSKSEVKLDVKGSLAVSHSLDGLSIAQLRGIADGKLTFDAEGRLVKVEKP